MEEEGKGMGRRNHAGGAEGEGTERPQDGAATPFDGPFAAPLLFGVMAAWFAYDGWWNHTAGAQRWLWLSRGAAGLCLLLAVRFLVRGVRERLARR